MSHIRNFFFNILFWLYIPIYLFGFTTRVIFLVCPRLSIGFMISSIFRTDAKGKDVFKIALDV